MADISFHLAKTAEYHDTQKKLICYDFSLFCFISYQIGSYFFLGQIFDICT